MAESDRHRLHQALEHVIGADEANLLMSQLPPFDWTRLATKDDLAAALDAKFEVIDTRFEALESRFESRFEGLEARFESKFDALEARLGGRITGVEARLGGRITLAEHSLTALETNLTGLIATTAAEIRAELHSSLRTNTLVTLGGVSALVTALFAASQLV